MPKQNAFNTFVLFYNTLREKYPQVGKLVNILTIRSPWINIYRAAPNDNTTTSSFIHITTSEGFLYTSITIHFCDSKNNFDYNFYYYSNAVSYMQSFIFSNVEQEMLTFLRYNSEFLQELKLALELLNVSFNNFVYEECQTELDIYIVIGLFYFMEVLFNTRSVSSMSTKTLTWS